MTASSDFLAAMDHSMLVVTAAHPRTGERSGCLAGFRTQCSIDPERLLVCISVVNHTYPIACAAPTLAVHLIPVDRPETAELFGGQTGDEIDKFSRCAWRPGPGSVPLLTDCPRWLVGDVLERVPFGDHVGFVLAPTTAQCPDMGASLMLSALKDLNPGHPA